MTGAAVLLGTSALTAVGFANKSPSLERTTEQIHLLSPRASEKECHPAEEQTVTSIREEMHCLYGEQGQGIRVVVPDLNKVEEIKDIFGEEKEDDILANEIYHQLDRINYNYVNEDGKLILSREDLDVQARLIAGIFEQSYSKHPTGFSANHTLSPDGKGVAGEIPISIQHYGDINRTSGDELVAPTNWENGSFIITRGELDGAESYKSVAHHELGHHAFNQRYMVIKNHNAPYEPGKYSAFKHETIAEVNRVLQLTQTGKVEKDDYIDYRSLRRGYEAMSALDGDHNATDALQALKQVPLDKIQSMDAQELAVYSMKFVLDGDRELGIQAPLLSKDEFDVMQGMLNGMGAKEDFNERKGALYRTLKSHIAIGYHSTFDENLGDRMATPLEIEKIMAERPQSFNEVETKFLTDNIVAYKDLVVTAMDYEKGLTDDPRAKALFEEMQNKEEVGILEEREDTTPDILLMGDIPEEEQTPLAKFHIEVQEHVFPVGLDGELRNDILPEARKNQLDTYQKALDEGTLTLEDIDKENAQAVLDIHRNALKELDSYKQKYGALDMSALDGEKDITPEKASKQAFMRAYLKQTTGDSIDEEIYMHDRFARQFEEGRGVPLPLDTTLTEVQQFFESQREILMEEREGELVNAKDKNLADRVTTDKDNLKITIHEK
jgi:hypothetical protein